MIYVVGSSNTDMIVKAPHIPAPGETILGGEFTTAAGGKGANQAVAVARCGGNVSFLAKLGNDALGDQAIASFKADGIDVSHVLRDPNTPSGVAVIMVNHSGENSIAVAPGSNSLLCPTDVEGIEPVLDETSTLLIQLEIPIETVEKSVSIACSRGANVILNPAPACELSDDLLSQVSIITPNESEASLLTGIEVKSVDDAIAAGRKLLQRGIDNAVITMGSSGALIVRTDGEELVPTTKVDVVDTTAAGDTFNGALAVALSEGSSLKNAVVFANAAAALSVGKLGAQQSVPSREEIDAMLSQSR